MAQHKLPRFQRGLTLIEACVTLTVIGILAGSALPAFDDFMVTRRIEGHAAEAAVDLHYARSEAVSRNEGVRMSFHDVAGGSCTLVHTGATSDCSCSSTGAAQCTNGATALKTLFQPVGSGVVIRANVASMRFDPNNGTVTPAGTVRVTGTDGRTIHHVVNILGRVRSCSPGGAVRGVAAC